MSRLEYVKPTPLSLRTHPEFNEQWLQERIAEDPGILGLGDLILKDKERTQPRAGRLDLLLQHADDNSRYTVEVQLGATDESHIIRTIEYWDVERKRYPQYEHTAVLVAENVTSRFLNVISLLNGTIPLVVVQLNAFQIESRIALTFTTVLDVLPLGLVDEDEEVAEATDRSYWLARGTKETVAIADQVFGLVQEIDDSLSLKYNKFYIGLARDGRALNFVEFKPKKKWMDARLRLPRSEETEARAEEAGLEIGEYDTRYRRYPIRLTKGDVGAHRDVLASLLRQAHDTYMG
ncbi:hypothetical protein [Rubrivirga sp.]|uniref:hypothetical protein n=1 Tax=Rubrivirga sp. TaxID=1885344 RepID=UPI003B51CC7A